MAFYTVNGQLAFLEDGQKAPEGWTPAKDPNAAGVTDAYLKSDAYAKQKAADAEKAKRAAATRVNANPTATQDQLKAYDSYWAGSEDMTPSQVDSRLTAALLGNGNQAQNAATAKQIDATKASTFDPNADPGAWGSVYQGIKNQNPVTGTGVVDAAAGGGAGGGAGGVGAGGGAGGGAGTGTGTGTGIVDSALPPPPTPDTVQPVLGQVNVPQTVQGQLGDILKSGNPLLEAAKARAMQTANARGLQNSSMAAQAGEEAVLAAAMPIAQQDAAVYQKQALTNQAIQNEFLSMEKGKAIDLEKAYAAFQQNNYRFDKDEALKRYINDTGNSTQLKIAAMQKAVSDAQLNQRLEEIKLSGNIAMEQLLKQQDYTTQQNMLQLKANNFTNFTTQLNALTAAELEPADKANKINILIQQYAGAPMPDGWVPPVFG